MSDTPEDAGSEPATSATPADSSDRRPARRWWILLLLLLLLLLACGIGGFYFWKNKDAGSTTAASASKSASAASATTAGQVSPSRSGAPAVVPTASATGGPVAPGGSATPSGAAGPCVITDARATYSTDRGLVATWKVPGCGADTVCIATSGTQTSSAAPTADTCSVTIDKLQVAKDLTVVLHVQPMAVGSTDKASYEMSCPAAGGTCSKTT